MSEWVVYNPQGWGLMYLGLLLLLLSVLGAWADHRAFKKNPARRLR